VQRTPGSELWGRKASRTERSKVASHVAAAAEEDDDVVVVVVVVGLWKVKAAVAASLSPPLLLVVAVLLLLDPKAKAVVRGRWEGEEEEDGPAAAPLWSCGDRSASRMSGGRGGSSEDACDSRGSP
jgi:hypothetical protein